MIKKNFVLIKRNLSLLNMELKNILICFLENGKESFKR